MSDEKHDPTEAFELPDTVDLASVDAAEQEIIRLAARGRLTPLSALRFIRMLDHRRRAIADVDLEQRMNALDKELDDDEEAA
jgi:hypothetical protein